MKRISERATAMRPHLLDRLRHGALTTDAIEVWWEQRPGVLRVELHRLLRQMVEDGDLERRGNLWALPGKLPRSLPDGHARVSIGTGDSSTAVVVTGPSEKVGKVIGSVTVTPPMPAPPTVSVTLNINGKPEDAVTITGQVKERVEAVVRAYQRDTARGTTARPSTPQPKVDTRYKPAPGTVAHKILASLKRGPKTDAEIRARLDLNPNTLRGRLSELAAGGWLAKNSDGRWEVIS